MVFRKHRKHYGIILLRLTDERPINKIAVLKVILEHHAHEIERNFIVATDKAIRITNPISLH